MEGSGLREVLEDIYAPNTVNHIFTGKVYSRVLRAHLIVASALVSIIIENFIESLLRTEKNDLLSLISSKHIENISNHPIIVRLATWFETEKVRLTQKSRTGRLWISYIN